MRKLFGGDSFLYRVIFLCGQCCAKKRLFETRFDKLLCEPISDMQREQGLWKRWKTSWVFPQAKGWKRKFSTKLCTLSTEGWKKECGKNGDRRLFCRILKVLKFRNFSFLRKGRKANWKYSVNRFLKNLTKNKVGIVTKKIQKNGIFFYKRKKDFCKFWRIK